MPNTKNQYDLFGQIANLMMSESSTFKGLMNASGLSDECSEISDMDLSGVDLSNQDLSSLNLEHAIFENATLSGAKLLGSKVDPIEVQFALELDEALLDEKTISEIEAIGSSILLYTRIDELELSVRTYSVFKRQGLEVIGQICQFSESELIRFPNFGRKSLNEIKECLQDIGLSLGMKYDERFSFHRDTDEYTNHRDISESVITDYPDLDYSEQHLFFVENLRRIRVRRGITQRRLAKLARLSVSTVGAVERLRSEKHVSTLTLVRLLDALGVDSSELEYAKVV